MLTIVRGGRVFVVGTRGENRVKKQYTPRSGLMFIRHEGETHYVHKLVAEKFVKNPNGYKCVRHIDGDRSNNAASNLEWTKNRRGSKLTGDDVKAIRASSESGVALAAKYGVSGASITNIRKGIRWS